MLGGRVKDWVKGPICGLEFSNPFHPVVPNQTAQDFPQEQHQVCSRGVPRSTGFQEHPESRVPHTPHLCTSSSDMLKLAQQDAE